MSLFPFCFINFKLQDLITEFGVASESQFEDSPTAQSGNQNSVAASVANPIHVVAPILNVVDTLNIIPF